MNRRVVPGIGVKFTGITGKQLEEIMLFCGESTARGGEYDEERPPANRRGPFWSGWGECPRPYGFPFLSLFTGRSWTSR